MIIVLYLFSRTILTIDDYLKASNIFGFIANDNAVILLIEFLRTIMRLISFGLDIVIVYTFIKTLKLYKMYFPSTKDCEHMFQNFIIGLQLMLLILISFDNNIL